MLFKESGLIANVRYLLVKLRIQIKIIQTEAIKDTTIMATLIDIRKRTKATLVNMSSKGHRGITN